MEDLEARFEVRQTDFMARDGKGRSSLPRCEKKVCLVATDKEHLVRLLLAISGEPECYWVKYAIHPTDGMYLGRVFMTTDDAAGALWNRLRFGDDKVLVTIQDDEFTARFRRRPLAGYE